MAETEERNTKYEIARMIGSRALQLSMGAPFLVKLSEDDLKSLKYNVTEIAKRELKEGVLPITVRRPLPKVQRREESSNKEIAA